MAPSRRPRGERLAESGRAQIRAVRGGRDTGQVPAGPGGGHPASHRAGDTRGISPPTYPCALERSTMSGKSREPSPSTDISDPAGSRETTERPGSCRPPVDVAKPDRRAAASSAQRWQIPESGTTAAVSAGRGPALTSWPTPPAASAGSRSGRSIWSLSPTASPHPDPPPPFTAGRTPRLSRASHVGTRAVLRCQVPGHGSRRRGRRRHRQAGWRSSRSAPAPWSPAHGA